jgi:HK97 family phage portal protein
MGKAENLPDGEEKRSLEDPTVPISSRNIIKFLGLEDLTSNLPPVTVDAAMTVPALMAAVNFISGTVAGLPLNTYRKGRDGRKPLNNRIARLLHNNVNEEMSSFEWRKYKFERLLTHGRALTLIVRGENVPIRYLWPLNPRDTSVRRLDDGRRVYKVMKGPHKGEYPASDVIDLSFALKDDGLRHYSPIFSHKDTVSLAIAAARYATRFFQNGGIPPFVIIGNFMTQAGIERASADMKQAILDASREGRNALPIPKDHEVKALGLDPEKTQMVETRRFIIEEIARIYSLPPTFLQDLTHGTFSNTEQQDLHFVKHTLKRWIEQFEQELNLKLFGWEDNTRYVEFNVDGLLRGDFKTRMDGNAQAIQTGQLTPNEARRRENLPDLSGGDQLFIQGATVPINQAGNGQEPSNGT